MRGRTIAVMTAVLAVFISCRHDGEEVVQPDPTPEPEHGVTVDLAALPYQSLSEYNFFVGNMADQQPNARVLPYDVITPLFADYAHKHRFVWMPQGVSATFSGPDVPLDFPNGTILIKTFYFDHVQPTDATRLLETRLMIKRDGQWIFADYIWNEEQTEATLDLNGRFVPLTWRDDGGADHQVSFRIPAWAECFTCHKQDGQAMPIGPKLRNLARAYDYPEGSQDQIGRWVNDGYLQTGFPTPQPVAKWDDPSLPLLDRVRGYVDMNCSHCHADGKHCDYRPMRFAWQETSVISNIGVCVEPEDPLPESPELTYIVAPGNTYRSMLLHRISATDEAVRMPLLGRTVVHQEAVDLFTEWINSMSGPCN